VDGLKCVRLLHHGVISLGEFQTSDEGRGPAEARCKARQDAVPTSGDALGSKWPSGAPSGCSFSRRRMRSRRHGVQRQLRGPEDRRHAGRFFIVKQRQAGSEEFTTSIAGPASTETVLSI
jgi:hypothetical protein